MKTSLVGALIVAGAVGFGLTATAQDKPGAKPAPGAQADTQKPAAKEHTMTGCLQKGADANTYVVVNSEAKGPKMIGIVESKENLAPHVGHKIDITGVAVSAKEVDSLKTKPAKGDHYMRLSAIKMISADCK
jgi:hypothetical protein